jgi:hypothetical protein
VRGEVTVTVWRDDGTIITRTVRHERVNYPRRETVAQFNVNLRRRAQEAINAVLGRST